jgi:hypothetical protein
MDDRIKPTLWDRTRWPRYAFVAGVLVGGVAGWFFHQVVSFLMGASVMLIVFVLLLIIGFLWWRTRSHGMRERGPTVVRWRYDTAIGAPRIDPASSYHRGAVYDPFADSSGGTRSDDTGRRRRRSRNAEYWPGDGSTDSQGSNGAQHV